MITLPSLDALPSKWNEIREQLEIDFSADLEALLHERFTEHEAKQLEQDFIDSIGCAPEEYVRIRRAIRLLETRYPDSPNELTVAAVATPLGEMLAVFGGKGLCLLEFVGQKQLEQEITAVQKALHGQFIFQENEQTQLLRQELDLYFQGRLKVFATPLETIGTAFQQQVWNALLTIPTAKRAATRSRRNSWAILKPFAPLPLPTGRTKCPS